MFIGHFAPAAFAAGGRIKLWHAFLSVQFMDLLWAVLILLDIERIRILENATSVHHYHSDFIGFSHGLFYTIIWSLVAGFLFLFTVNKATKKDAFIIGLFVMSHWVLDLITHMPNLEIWPNGPIAGFGLWRYFIPSLVFEIGIFVLGFGFYLKRNWSNASALGKIICNALMLISIGLLLVGYTSPPPPSIGIGVTSTLIIILVLTLAAALCDRFFNQSKTTL